MTAEQTDNTPDSPPPPASQKKIDVLGYCENGDLVRVKEIFATTPKVELLPPAHDMLVRACKAKQPHMVQYLIHQFPDLETTQQLHSAAFSGGIEVYGIVLNRYPILKEHGFGHTSDPISEAVLHGDVEMLDFLLAQGFEAKNSHYCYIPVLVFAQEQEVSQEIIDRLKRHGATEELPF